GPVHPGSMARRDEAWYGGGRVRRSPVYLGDKSIVVTSHDGLERILGYREVSREGSACDVSITCRVYSNTLSIIVVGASQKSGVGQSGAVLPQLGDEGIGVPPSVNGLDGRCHW